jgi:1,6-anhydro-N-acetylmuramate kinase
MTAEAEARAGSHFRRVLHDESGQNWRGQLAKRSDASLPEVLSKLTQVTTVVSNGTFGESTLAAQILNKPRNR